MRLKSRSATAVMAVATIWSGQALAAEPKAAPKPESPFILCDGRTGHVGLAEQLGRLIAITATAGLSEVATKTDNDTRRLKGNDAAAACATAIAMEGNPLRRTQLAMARSVHLLEADRADEALAAARAVPTVAGPFAQDWGYKRTLEPRVMLLEAVALTRLRRMPEAEAMAVRALQVAPYDVALLQKAAPFLSLTPTLTPEKEAVLVQAAKVHAGFAGLQIAALCTTGRFPEADRQLEANDAAMAPFMGEYHPEPTRAYRSLILALAGDFARSDALAADYEKGMAALAGSGYVSKRAAGIAVEAEMLALRRILRDAAQGRPREARTTFVGRSPWLLVPPALLSAAIDKLRVGAAPDELSGPLAETGEQARQRRLDDTVVNLVEQKSIETLIRQTLYYAKQSDYVGAGKSTWQVSPKPKFLMKTSLAEHPDVFIMNTLPRVDGLAAGDAVMLQAALIAKSRGNTGFVVAPMREYVGVIGLRFGNLGAPGFPAAASFDAAKVEEDLKAVIPPPPPPA